MKVSIFTVSQSPFAVIVPDTLHLCHPISAITPFILCVFPSNDAPPLSSSQPVWKLSKIFKD